MRCKLLDDNQIPYPVTNYVHINNLTTVVILKESNDGYAIYTNKEMSANNIEIYVDVIIYDLLYDQFIPYNAKYRHAGF